MTIRNWSSSVCSTVLTLCRRDLLEERGRAEAALDVVTATRRYWEDDASVRVDDLARQQIDREGIWLSGWLRARTGVTAFDRIDPVQLASAIAALPPLSRQVFLLHAHEDRSEEHTSELQSLMRISYAVFGLKKKNKYTRTHKQ